MSGVFNESATALTGKAAPIGGTWGNPTPYLIGTYANGYLPLNDRASGYVISTRALIGSFATGYQHVKQTDPSDVFPNAYHGLFKP